MEKTYTCIVCPAGCRITARTENGVVSDIRGNQCKRGETYVQQEARAPMRNIASTVRVDGGTAHLVPVKTVRPIPKAEIMPVMDAIRQAAVQAPVARGQVILANAAGCGADIVATAAVAKRAD